MTKQFYTVEEVSKVLNLHEKTVQRYIREGKLKANKIGKAWRIEQESVNAFLGTDKAIQLDNPYDQIKVSSVVDIDVVSTDQAINIANLLTATLQSKDKMHGRSSLNIQFIEPENKVRVMLWGNIKFTEDMMSFISSYVLNK